MAAERPSVPSFGAPLIVFLSSLQVAKPSVTDAMELPFREEKVSSLWIMSLEGQRGDIWALGELFQITQNCWELNWQSKRKYNR